MYPESSTPLSTSCAQTRCTDSKEPLRIGSRVNGCMSAGSRETATPNGLTPPLTVASVGLETSQVRGERVQIVMASFDMPRSVTFGLYRGSPSRRALGNRDVTADNAIDASIRASGAPRQKDGPCPNAKW